MLNEVASTEEMPLVQLPNLQKGSNQFEMCVRLIYFPNAGGDQDKNKLSMLFGVTLPCILSIFSVILFLRLGLIIGQVRDFEDVPLLYK